MADSRRSGIPHQRGFLCPGNGNSCRTWTFSVYHMGSSPGSDERATWACLPTPMCHSWPPDINWCSSFSVWFFVRYFSCFSAPFRKPCLADSRSILTILIDPIIHSCPLSPQVLPATATRASNSRTKGGAAFSGACGPQWAGMCARTPTSACKRKPCDRRMPGAWLA